MRNKKVLIIIIILITVGGLISFKYFKSGRKNQIPSYVIESVKNNRVLEIDNADSKKSNLEKELYKYVMRYGEGSPPP